jgi:hypothetical protein
MSFIISKAQEFFGNLFSSKQEQPLYKVTAVSDESSISNSFYERVNKEIAKCEHSETKHRFYLTTEELLQAKKLLKKLQKQDCFKKTDHAYIILHNNLQLPNSVRAKVFSKGNAFEKLQNNGLILSIPKRMDDTVNWTENGILIHKFLNQCILDKENLTAA